MMIFDYTLNYADQKVLLTGKKYLLSKKTEISSKWKVFPIFEKQDQTKVCGIRISHLDIPEESFGQENVENKWTSLISIPVFEETDYFCNLAIG